MIGGKNITPEHQLALARLLSDRAEELARKRELHIRDISAITPTKFTFGAVWLQLAPYIAIIIIILIFVVIISIGATKTPLRNIKKKHVFGIFNFIKKALTRIFSPLVNIFKKISTTLKKLNPLRQGNIDTIPRQKIAVGRCDNLNFLDINYDEDKPSEYNEANPGKCYVSVIPKDTVWNIDLTRMNEYRSLPEYFKKDINKQSKLKIIIPYGPYRSSTAPPYKTDTPPTEINDQTYFVPYCEKAMFDEGASSREGSAKDLLEDQGFTCSLVEKDSSKYKAFNIITDNNGNDTKALDYLNHVNF